jgi:hypothetical protein
MDSEFDSILFTCPQCEGWAISAPTRVLVKCQCCGELIEVPHVALEEYEANSGAAISPRL